MHSPKFQRLTFVFAAIAILGGCQLTVTSDGSGSVSAASGLYDCSDTCIINVDPGFSETFTATADSGHEFVTWTGWQGCSTDPVCRLEVPDHAEVEDGEALLTAQFRALDGSDEDNDRSGDSSKISDHVFEYTDDLVLEYDLIEGTKDGTETIRHATEGWLHMETSWLNGEKHGFERVFESSGQLMSNVSFSNGIKDGLAQFYDLFGNLDREEVYLDGEVYELFGDMINVDGKTVTIDRDSVRNSIDEALSSLNLDLDFDLDDDVVSGLFDTAEDLLGGLLGGNSDGGDNLFGGLSDLLSGVDFSGVDFSGLGLDLGATQSGNDCDDDTVQSMFSNFACMFQ